MYRLLSVAALAVLPAFSQFESLATDDSGSQLYFSTRLRPIGSSDSSWPKVYRLDRSGFELAAQSPQAPGGSLETGGWMVVGSSLNADGSVVALHSRFVCRFGTPCVSMPQEFSEIRTRLGSRRVLGTAHVSRSGRYVSIWRQTGFGLIGGSEADRWVNRLDLETGVGVPVGPPPAQSGKWIGSDGTILINGWQLVTPAGGAIPMGLQPRDVYRAELSANTAVVVYQAKQEPSAIRIRHRSGADELLAEVGTSPAVSADSRQVLYLAPVDGKMQAFLWEDGASRQITREPEGLTEATLSGVSGLIVATTGAGELITVDARSGYRSEYISKSPLPGPFPVNIFGEPDSVYPAQAFGSAYTIFGEHLAGSEGVRVFVNRTPAPAISVSPEKVSYQVSWETRESGPGNPPEVVLRRGEQSFELVHSLRSVGILAPAFVAVGSEVLGSSSLAPIYAIHGDWRGLVTRGDPALEGEYVHLYATGFGPVFPPVETGAPGPVLPPAALASPLNCTWIGDTAQPVDVAFAGLAPGVIGIYQVTVRMPDDLTIPAAAIGLSCYADTAVARIGIRVTP